MHGLSFTADNTKGFKIFINPVCAKIAFLRLFPVTIILDGIIGADCHAGLTSVAFPLIQDHRTIFPLGKGLCWTRIHAGGMDAVVAETWKKTHLEIGKTAHRRVLLCRVLGLNTNPVFFRIVLFFAGHGAGLTSNTPFLVYDKAQSLFQPITS